MSNPAKFLFDENFGKPLIKRFAALQTFAYPEVLIEHILDLYPPGTKDPDWIPRLKHGGYIIVTQDRGKQGKREEKLPMLCARYGVLTSSSARQSRRMDSWHRSGQL